MAKKRSHRPCSLRLECLERRDAMTGLSAVVSTAGVLTISGTPTNSTYQINETSSQISVAGVSGSFADSKVKSIVVNLDGGNDTVLLNSASVKGQIALNVGVTVNSGAGNDDVRLANNTDVYFSGAGHALSVTSTGVATLDHASLTWADQNIQTAAIRALVKTDVAAGALNRTEMLAVFTTVEKVSNVTATEFSDLKLIASDTALYGSLTYVQVLTSDVVAGNAANATYLGSKLGNLAVGSTSVTLTDLVGKWFQGTDLPKGTSDWGPTYGYANASGTLFGSAGPQYTDVYQGGLGDCYYLSSLANVAKATPAAITSMFIVNGDGTYTVRLYANGKADYVTVNTQLPVDSSGRFVFASMGDLASNKSNVLWVALAEKAFVEWHASGLEGQGAAANAPNQYTSISGGYGGLAMSEITDRSNVSFNSFMASSSFTSFVNDYKAGNLIEFASKASPPMSTVVGDHAYAVVGYNATNQTVTLFNPWGINNGSSYPGLITLTWAQIQANFSSWDRLI